MWLIFPLLILRSKNQLYKLSQEYVFSKIVFGKDREDLAKYGDANDIFDGNEGVGVPEVPFFPLSLQIPEGARYDVRIEGVEYLNKYTGDVSDSEMLYYLSNDYVPSQQYSADEKLREIQFDRKEYAKDKYNELYTISEPLGYHWSYFDNFAFYLFPSAKSNCSHSESKNSDWCWFWNFP